MRLLALVPIALCITSLILAFLCLFAGSQSGFLEDYAVLTVSLLLDVLIINAYTYTKTSSSSTPPA